MTDTQEHEANPDAPQAEPAAEAVSVETVNVDVAPGAEPRDAHDGGSEALGSEPRGSEPGSMSDTAPVPSLPHVDATAVEHAKENAQKSAAARRKKKEDRLEKIGVYMTEHESITNDDVEALLDVSDTTAANYIKELMKRGVLEKVGEGVETRYHMKVLSS